MRQQNLQNTARHALARMFAILLLAVVCASAPLSVAHAQTSRQVNALLDAGVRPLVLLYEHAYMTTTERADTAHRLRRSGYGVDRPPHLREAGNHCIRELDL